MFFFSFQSCLGTIYTVYVENISVPLETLVGNILGCVQVPPPGGPQVRFSIGAGDRQALQPPLSPSLPVSHTAVSLLFQTLGKTYSIFLKNSVFTNYVRCFWQFSDPSSFPPWSNFYWVDRVSLDKSPPFLILSWNFFLNLFPFL